MRIICIFSLFILISSFSSCSKRGCTDTLSINYDKNAGINDGSCTYKSQLIIWFDAAKSAEYTAIGITDLTFFLGTENIGTLPIGSFATTTPNCGDPIGISKSLELGKKPNADLKLTITRETGAILSILPVKVTGNSCTSFRLP